VKKLSLSEFFGKEIKFYAEENKNLKENYDKKEIRNQRAGK